MSGLGIIHRQVAHAFRESALRFVLLPWKEFTSRFDVYLVTGGNRVYAGGTDYSFFFPPILFLFEFPRNQRVSADCPSLRKVCTIDREHEIRLKAERSRNTRHDFTFMAEHRDSNNNDDPRNLIRVRRCTKGFQRVNEWFTRNRGFSIFCFRLFFFFFFFLAIHFCYYPSYPSYIRTFCEQRFNPGKMKQI